MAAKLNELRQKVLDSKAALNALLSEQSEARAKYSALLALEAAGTISDEDKAKMADAEKAAGSFEPRLKAQRQLLQNHEQDLVDAQAQSDKDKEKADGSGLIQV